MVKNIIYLIIAVVIIVPSWQVGTIMLEKKKVTYMIQEEANKIKKYDNPDLVKRYVKENLELMNLPTEFSFKVLERRKVKIGYSYYGAATLFGYTYYEVSEEIEAVTEDGKWG